METLQTPVTKLLGCQTPIIQGGMVWVSGWRLAAAVSNAGGFGLIGAGSMDEQLLETHIAKTRAATKRPFGVNVPLMRPSSAKQIEICIQHKVRAVFTAAGSPKLFTDKLHAAGIKVVHVVPSARHALKAAQADCDAVVAEGTEAGGHNGFDELTSIVLWPSVVGSVDIPVIAAGGIVDGATMAAALALGAQGVQVGTRFAATKESSASQTYKQAVVAAQEGEAKLYLRCVMPTRALANSYVNQAIAEENAGASREHLLGLLGKGRTKKGIFEGDLEQGELEMGQASSRITDIPSAGELLRRFSFEFQEALRRLNNRNCEPQFVKSYGDLTNDHEKHS